MCGTNKRSWKNYDYSRYGPVLLASFDVFSPCVRRAEWSIFYGPDPKNAMSRHCSQKYSRATGARVHAAHLPWSSMGRSRFLRFAGQNAFNANQSASCRRDKKFHSAMSIVIEARHLNVMDSPPLDHTHHQIGDNMPHTSSGRNGGFLRSSIYRGRDYLSRAAEWTAGTNSKNGIICHSARDMWTVRICRSKCFCGDRVSS